MGGVEIRAPYTDSSYEKLSTNFKTYRRSSLRRHSFTTKVFHALSFWIFRYLKSNSMDHSSSSEANSSSASKDVLILRNQQVRHYVHQIQPLVIYSNKTLPVRALPSQHSKIHFNIIVPSPQMPSTLYPSFRFTLRTPEWISFPFQFISISTLNME
jgi:hypothetical protein